MQDAGECWNKLVHAYGLTVEPLVIPQVTCCIGSSGLQHHGRMRLIYKVENDIIE